ncbi:MAG: hypothetical protein WCL71_02970 [Deltaproteobacteria bacterium]
MWLLVSTVPDLQAALQSQPEASDNVTRIFHNRNMSVTLMRYSGNKFFEAGVKAIIRGNDKMTEINKTKYAEIGRKMRELPLEKHGSSYEWEELVQKLCASGDARLHGIGIREMRELKQKSIAISPAKQDKCINEIIFCQ